MTSFVNFALKITDTTESIPAIIDDEIKRKDTPVDLNPEWAHWTPITQRSKRLDFLGDSLLVCNWINSAWPVKNPRHFPDVVNCGKELHLIFGQNVHPRAKHLPWLRHMKRGFNEIPNQLATMGKTLGRNDLVVMMEQVNVDNDKYWRGQFDGGYDPGSTTIGVGMYFCFSEQCPRLVWDTAPCLCSMEG